MYICVSQPEARGPGVICIYIYIYVLARGQGDWHYTCKP